MMVKTVGAGLGATPAAGNEYAGTVRRDFLKPTPSPPSFDDSARRRPGPPTALGGEPDGGWGPRSGRTVSPAAFSVGKSSLGREAGRTLLTKIHARCAATRSDEFAAFGG